MVGEYEGRRPNLIYNALEQEADKKGYLVSVAPFELSLTKRNLWGHLTDEATMYHLQNIPIKPKQ
jgi:hypothetical protein